MKQRKYFISNRAFNAIGRSLRRRRFFSRFFASFRGQTQTGDELMNPIRPNRAKGARKAAKARTARIAAIGQLATRNLLSLAQSRLWKAMPEQAGNRQVARELAAHNAIADAACSVLLQRGLQEMERNGADLQVCQCCERFGRLMLSDVGGCPHAGQATCLGKRQTAPCAGASSQNAARRPDSSTAPQVPSPESSR